MGERDSSKTLSTKVLAAGVCVCAVTLCLVFHDYVFWSFKQIPLVKRFFRVSVSDQVFKYGTAARARLNPKFQRLGIQYPPDRVSFIVNKSTRELLVYARETDGAFEYVCNYPVLGASGHLGPKLNEGDMQVPEGIYTLTLEPNTPYHVALRLNYPNDFDLARAKEDGRNNPGSDILIHGTNGSVGCIAVGDPASEDLFVLTNDTGKRTIELIVVPFDLWNFDKKQPLNIEAAPHWLPELYTSISDSLKKYPMPGK